MLAHQPWPMPSVAPHTPLLDAPLVNTPLAPRCATTVIIPACDEAERIAATLAALAAQTDLDGQPLDHGSFEIIVLANNCTDATAGLARRVGQAHPTLALHVVELLLPPELSSAGAARRLLMDEACRRLLGHGRPGGVIASLDADTHPAPTWLAATRHEFARGVDAVGGRITTDPAERAALPTGARLRHLRDVAYRSLLAELETLLDPVAHDPWPRHYQHFGASLAVTADAYRRAGGLPPVECARRCRLLLRPAPRRGAATPQPRRARDNLGPPRRPFRHRLRAAIRRLGQFARDRRAPIGRFCRPHRVAVARPQARTGALALAPGRGYPTPERRRRDRPRPRRAAPLARRTPRSGAPLRCAR